MTQRRDSSSFKSFAVHLLHTLKLYGQSCKMRFADSIRRVGRQFSAAAKYIGNPNPFVKWLTLIYFQNLFYARTKLGSFLILRTSLCPRGLVTVKCAMDGGLVTVKRAMQHANETLMTLQSRGRRRRKHANERKLQRTCREIAQKSTPRKLRNWKILQMKCIRLCRRFRVLRRYRRHLHNFGYPGKSKFF